MPRLKKSAVSECDEVARRLVEDPYEPGKTILVTGRLDPLHRMLVRKEIDAAQAKAGAILRQCHELVGSSGVRAMDLSAERVDGGRRANGVPEGVLYSARRLHQAQALLGWQAYRLLLCCVCEGCPPSTVAEQSAVKVDRGTVSWQLRSSLEQLAVLWGLAQDPRRVRQRAAIVAAMKERPSWVHEEQELAIQYA